MMTFFPLMLSSSNRPGFVSEQSTSLITDSSKEKPSRVATSKQVAKTAVIFYDTIH
jgi:hypothetical protein